jgi:acetylornithine/succinyldiaminopimelate/putrescine aminotransferase
MEDHVTLITEAVANRIHKTLQVTQTDSPQKAKLVRFFGQFTGQKTQNLTMSIQEKKTQKIHRPSDPTEPSVKFS